MPLYRVILTCNATVDNHYQVEADSAEEAIDKVKTGAFECLREDVTPDGDTYAEARRIEPEPATAPKGKAAKR